VITLEDCIALCGLSKQEVMAVAEHDGSTLSSNVTGWHSSGGSDGTH
jgi:hypothetical protein